MDLQELSPSRFWLKVDMTGDCWKWLGARNESGYGQFDIASPAGKRWRAMAHRFAYEAVVGPIPDGLELDHLCRNRICVNPNHLEPVTGIENRRRGIGGGGKTHCAQGHEFTPENTRIRTDRLHGGRVCVECRRNFQKISRRRAALRAVPANPHELAAPTEPTKETP